jgi:hypothetical protein
MPTLPDMGTLLVRTDFTDDDAWDQVRDESTREYGPDGFRAYVTPVSDPQWSGAAWETVKAAAPAGDTGPVVLFIADGITFASQDHPVLVVDLLDKCPSVTEEFPEIAGRTPFRCIASALWDVENNLNIANIDWEDYGSRAEDGVYRGFELPPPPTAEEKAEAEQQARLEAQQAQERARLASELSYWGGRLPSDRLRAAGGNAQAMARLDIGLAEAIAAASPDIQRLIARWAARRAYEVAGIADIVWIAPALLALDQGQELPWPFDDKKEVWRLLFSDLEVPRTTVASIVDRFSDLQPAQMMRSATAVPALFAAAGPDPLNAALQALFAAATAFGRDDYPALLEEVRRAFSLLGKLAGATSTCGQNSRTPKIAATAMRSIPANETTAATPSTAIAMDHLTTRSAPLIAHRQEQAKTPWSGRRRSCA